MIRIALVGLALLLVGGAIGGVGYYIAQSKKRSAETLANAKTLMRPATLGEAVKNLDSVLAGDPNNQEALLLRGRARRDLGKLDEALEDLTALLAQDPEHLEALVTRASIYGKLNRDREAIEDFQHAIKIAPSAELHSERALLYQKQGEHRKALEDWNAVIELSPMWPTNYRSRARTYQALGDQAAAARDLETARRIEGGGSYR
jgi:tetratricopeptide (TPR) repeat protein